MNPLDFTKPHVLRDEGEFHQAVVDIDELLDRDPEPYSEEYERLELLSVLVENYEDRHVSFDPASPPQVVEFMLDQKGMERSDLAEVMGERSRVPDFFHGKREL